MGIRGGYRCRLVNERQARSGMLSVSAGHLCRPGRIGVTNKWPDCNVSQDMYECEDSEEGAGAPRRRRGAIQEGTCIDSARHACLRRGYVPTFGNAIHGEHGEVATAPANPGQLSVRHQKHRSDEERKADPAGCLSQKVTERMATVAAASCISVVEAARSDLSKVMRCRRCGIGCDPTLVETILF